MLPRVHCFVFIMTCAFVFQTSPRWAAGAVSADAVWRSVDDDQVGGGDTVPPPPITRYSTFQLNRGKLESVLDKAPMELSVDARRLAPILDIPMPDGGYERFRAVESPIMEAELGARFPEIKTYSAQGVDDQTAAARFDWTPLGFHAIVTSSKGTSYVDPYSRGETMYYVSYYRQDYLPAGKQFSCQADGAFDLWPDSSPAGLAPLAPSGTTLRTYRVAVAATGEYTAAYGGTVGGALAGITTTVNRVNAIYEREVAARMVLVGTETSIIYTNSATDPYTNNNGSTMLGQNQTNLDSVIGDANYDIGHVFSTGGGGVAYLGVVCQSGWKARGVTGSSNPVGDPFDVDYVAHEMGHQFDGDHTFNGSTGSCGGGNRSSTAAYEPGSGSTIMAYAGICGSEDLQPHSDDYFHTKSFDQIAAFITSGVTCSANAATGNNPPTIEAGPSYTIPIRTPFVLTATGSDPDGDGLTYCWEEYDLGTQSPPNTDNGSRPIFRSFLPVTFPSRMLPRLSDVLSNTSTLGESLPTTSRTMTFRCTARDNRAGGGGVNWDSTQVTSVTTAGPFAVTAPNTAVNWGQGTGQSVTWNVSGTSAAPISTANVNILLSTDGGITFPYTLASGTPNDGAQTIVVPGATTAQARIKVEAAGNIFFDISDTNFTVSSGGCSTITLSPSSLTAGTVGASYSQTVTASGGTSPYSYAHTAGTLPAGLSLSSGGVLSGTPSLAGSFTFTLTATDAGSCTGSHGYTIEVTGSACLTINLSPASLPAGTVGTPYSQPVAATGGSAPYTYSLLSGALPPPLSLAPSGAITGTPGTAGVYSFTIQASDAAACTGSKAFALTVNAGGCPTVSLSPSTLPSSEVGTPYNQTLTASGGSTPYTYTVAAGSLPPGVALSPGGVLSGTPTSGGDYAFSVAATDAAGCAGVQDYNLTVSGGGGYLYFDDFEDGSASDWRQVGGTWGVSAGDLRGSARKKTATILSPFGGCTACTAETEWQVTTAGASAALLAWYVDGANYVQLVMSDSSNKWTLEQYAAGKRVASRSRRGRISPGKLYRVGLSYNGTSVTASVNGRSKLTMPAASAPTGTIGLRVPSSGGRTATATFEQIGVKSNP
ncbi:MAG: putative Ig domain-containing protein [Acidobacteria bacterium]|nr:putative Ig domain-containing protein [Acidobacteriota bacterium]